MKKNNCFSHIGKKIVSMILMLAMLLSVHSPVFASEISEKDNLPYEEMNYNLDIVSLEDWENTEIGEYPLNEQSENWRLLSSCETAAACNMPKEYAESLTTRELVKYALNYPFLMDILFYDNVTDGINHLANKSYVFEELFSRTDCYEELIESYSDMEINYYELQNTNDICETNYDAELFVEIYIGLNYDLLSEEQAETFVDDYEVKFLEMNNECGDSMLATLFYDAIEETMEVIPDSAVPNAISEKFVETTDEAEMRASFICSECGATLSATTITVNSKSVSCYKWVSGGYSSSDITKLDNYMASNYSSYTKVRSASSKYNCHSYAWYSTSSSNIYWINDPSPVYGNTNYWTLWVIPMRNWQSGDRITFWSGSTLLHSAIVNSSSTCTSKLGHYGVYKTTISEMKSLYNSSSVEAYIPK